MHVFADLIERLILTPQRLGKLALLCAHLREVPDPDRGLAMAAIAGALDFPSAKPAALRGLIEQRVDPVLFQLSYDYVGDLAETISLIWPHQPGANRVPDFAEVIEVLSTSSRPAALRAVEQWLNAMAARERWALLKLLTGGFRIGAGARLVKQAFADFGGKDVSEIEALWHGLTPPYTDLLIWLEGRGEKPESQVLAPFRPVMLAHPLEEADLQTLNPLTFIAEWKWDGVRVQIAVEADIIRLYTRTGDDISHSFPDLVSAIAAALPSLTGDDDQMPSFTIDGELLLLERDTDRPGSFNDLQQRLNRKVPDQGLVAKWSAFVRAYDLLWLDGRDTQPETLDARRLALEQLLKRLDCTRVDLSPWLTGHDWDGLARLRADPPDPRIEGLMLKRRDGPYLIGRPKGHWYKWKREPHTVDCVMMYAQRGHGRRSGLYSDFTFGVWREGAYGAELVPVGKAYFGFTDAELKELDRFVRENTAERFGPVRAVTATAEAGLVLEIAFEGLARSNRHKSGVAMRFPRISRIRTDKRPGDADTLEGLQKLLSAV